MIEGWLFGRMDPISRIVAIPAIIALFWPDFTVEAAGVAVLLILLGWNWWTARGQSGKALAG